MSFFERPPEEVVLASPMSGQITLHGKPAAGAVVDREIVHHNEVIFSDSTTTNKSGEFHLPVIKKQIVLHGLEQFNVRQTVTAIYSGERYEIWYLSTGSKTLYGELYGKPINFRCELNNPPRPVSDAEIVSGLLETSCVWDGIDPEGEKNQ